MGDYYDFDFNEHGELCYVYQTSDTNYQPVFVKLRKEQKELASQLLDEMDKLHDKQRELIMSWVREADE